MFLGLELNKVGRDGMATTFLAGFCHQAQMLLGLAIAAVFGLFIALPYQFGYMGVGGSMPGTATPQPSEILSRMPVTGTTRWALA